MAVWFRHSAHLVVAALLAGCVSGPLATGPAPGSDPAASNPGGQAASATPSAPGTTDPTATSDDAQLDPPLPSYDRATGKLGMNVTLPASLFARAGGAFQTQAADAMSFADVKSSLKTFLKNPDALRDWSTNYSTVSAYALKLAASNDRSHKWVIKPY